MRTYQALGLLLVCGALAFVAGMRVGERRGPQPQKASDGSCCSLPANPVAQTAPKLKIPTGSGRPCLVEFGSDECEGCQRMAAVWQDVAPRLEEKVDLVQVDTDLYPAENQRWHLRMVPTQIVMDGQGQELWRHEGFIAANELLAQVAARTVSKPSSAAQKATHD